MLRRGVYSKTSFNSMNIRQLDVAGHENHAASAYSRFCQRLGGGLSGQLGAAGPELCESRYSALSHWTTQPVEWSGAAPCHPALH